MRLLIPLLALLLSPLAPADKLSLEDIRALRAQERILPLSELLARARRDMGGGRILETELEREDGRYIYEIRFLDPDGTVRELEYDAASGELLYYEVYRRRPDGRVVEQTFDARTGKLIREQFED